MSICQEVHPFSSLNPCRIMSTFSSICQPFSPSVGQSVCWLFVSDCLKELLVLFWRSPLQLLFHPFIALPPHAFTLSFCFCPVEPDVLLGKYYKETPVFGCLASPEWKDLLLRGSLCLFGNNSKGERRFS